MKQSNSGRIAWSKPSKMLHATNPFSTKCFQPGAIEYEFFGRQEWETFAQNCRTRSGCSLIVGPHGTGKSTLLQTLAHVLLRLEPEIRLEQLYLHDDGQSAKQFVASFKKWGLADMVLLDGFEQLSRTRRWLVVITAKWRRLPLVATSHAEHWGCRVAWRTTINEQTERWVMQRLLAGSPSDIVEQAMSSEHWRRSRETHKQNLRETLFDMYDWWAEHDKSVS